MLTKMRPLRPSHLLLLVDAYTRYLKSEPSFGVYYSQSARGLVQRGLFESRAFYKEGKLLVGFHLTQAGFEYLRNELSMPVQIEQPCWMSSEF